MTQIGVAYLKQAREKDWPEYRLTLDGPDFKKQRALIDRLCSCELFGEEVTDLLAGVSSLFDVIADQAHDCYGIDCLLEEDPTDE